MSLLSRFVNLLFDFLFPKSEKILALEELTPSEMLRTLPSALDTEQKDIMAVFSYEHPVVREMIWELKYRGNRVVAEKLGAILSDFLLETVSDRAMFDNFLPTQAGSGASERVVLIPMPISDKRRNDRGYNQTELLAEEIRKLDTGGVFKYLKGQLVKHRHTNAQTLAATRRERLENLAGSMHVVHPPSVEGKSVVLIDDVTTTGATFKEAKRALQEAGAKKIICIAVAH